MMGVSKEIILSRMIVASPTAALESLVMTLLIDAYEGRHVESYDIPGAILQASLGPRPSNELVLMKLFGEISCVK